MKGLEEADGKVEWAGGQGEGVAWTRTVAEMESRRRTGAYLGRRAVNMLMCWCESIFDENSLGKEFPFVKRITCKEPTSVGFSVTWRVKQSL